MDKQEYRLKTEQMLKYLKGELYEEALAIAESIDWSKVKNAPVLCAVSEVYEHCGQIEKSREILFTAYDHAPESKKVVYRLGILALKLGQLKEASDCYDEFVALAPKDPNRFVLKYKILKAKGAPLEEQIALLEEFKKVEYVEKWAFELALLYQQAGMISECLEECDDLILWFSEGTYIYKAMELKMQYKPLTPIQQEKYAKHQEDSKPVEEKAPVQEEAPASETPAEPEVEAVEAPAETVEEVAAEEPEEEVPAEEIVEEVQDPVKEEKEDKPTASIEEMVQNWQEQQKENAQIIQAQLQKAEQEKAQVELKEEEKEEILSDDVRRLMEQLEAESAEIAAQKTAAQEEPEEAPKPLLQKMVEQLSSLEGILERPEKAEKQPVEAPIEKEVEEIKEVEEDIKLGDTQSMAIATKALEKAVPVELPEIQIPTDEVFEQNFGKKSIAIPEEKTTKKSAAPYETEFVVQGKYDLDSQSEVGLKAGLSEEQKKLFSYFVPVHGVSEQLVKVLENDKKCTARYGTSRIGNIVIVGRKGSGKTVLAVNVVKAIQKSRKMKEGKVAIVKAEALNKKDINEIVEKLHGGALVIEKAARLNRDTIDWLCNVMEGQTGELLVVLEDERKPIDKMFSEFPNFKKKFTSRIELPVFINDELVTFGQTYAKENGYKIDETAILALYSDIDILQREEKVVTVSDVKELVDDAIENAKRFGFKKIFKKLFGKYRDESGRIILKEEDFK